MMEVIRSSETLDIARATRCHIPEDGILHIHCHENLKSYADNSVVSHKLSGFQGCVGRHCHDQGARCGRTKSTVLSSYIFSQWPQNIAVTVKSWPHCQDEQIHGWIVKIFQHFLSFYWCLASLNICHLQLTLNCPWIVSVIQTLLSSSKNVLQETHEIFQGFW
jgi:hypothetical protein